MTSRIQGSTTSPVKPPTSQTTSTANGPVRYTSHWRRDPLVDAIHDLKATPDTRTFTAPPPQDKPPAQPARMPKDFALKHPLQYHRFRQLCDLPGGGKINEYREQLHAASPELLHLQSRRDGDLPAHCAARSGLRHYLVVLIHRLHEALGPDEAARLLTTRNDAGDTPLHLAAGRGMKHLTPLTAYLRDHLDAAGFKRAMAQPDAQGRTVTDLQEQARAAALRR